MTRTRAFAVVGLAFLAVALLAGALSVRARLRASLPLLEGDHPLPGLEAPARIERDALGAPRIRAGSHRDAMRVLGFLHAQERFFAMDLLRRRPAGELAALFGEAALPLDREARLHRMRARAVRAVHALSPDERAIFEAYRDGVRAGLDALGAAPPEYLLLRQTPIPWEMEDSILAVAAMYFVLNDPTGLRDARVGALDRSLPPELVAFLHPPGTEYDAPLVGEAWPTPAIPPEIVVSGAFAETFNQPPAPVSGSNSWAVAASRAAAGVPLLANDMHLPHGAPNRWYRAEIHLPPARRAVGITLPGVPALVVGSNGSVAWGFTSSAGDWTDLVEIEPGPDGGYRAPEGALPFQVFEETIEVADGDSETLRVRETIWGPVIERSGRPRAIRWIAHDPEGLRAGYVHLLRAESVEDAFRIGWRSGVPPLNLVAADADGGIGWTIAGAIPRRRGTDGRAPASWADGARGWDGYLRSDEIPAIRNPPDGLLWTANNRIVDGEGLVRIGVAGPYAHGARARQIRDRLQNLEAANEESLLDIQLDDRALELSVWRELFLEAGAGDREATALLRDSWTGRASVDSVGYRLARAARLELFDRVYGELTAPALRAFEDFSPLVAAQWPGPLLRLAREQPAHYVPAGAADWNEALGDALSAAADAIRRAEEGRPLAEATWGRHNRVHVRHPMSQALPGLLRRFLDAPPRSLPGDSALPRAESPGHGPSQRMVVAPGREETGIFHMPGGQAGHPLAPYYLAGHEDWEEGRPTPLLAGPLVWTLVLTPPDD